MLKKIIAFSVLSYACFSCGSSPGEANGEQDACPEIFPDYAFVTIPPNIAPLNFSVPGARQVKADFSDGERPLLSVSGDSTVRISEKAWRKLLREQQGKPVSVTVSVWNPEHPGGVRYRPFTWTVAADTIDRWIAYRLIEPGYESWNRMGIYQRDLSSFDEKSIVTNLHSRMACLNCHAFPQNSPDRFMFHVRGADGGTFIVREGNVEKVKLNELAPEHKNGSYPCWNPTGRYIAFSSNVTRQAFYDRGRQPLDVYDLESDLFVYDVENRRVLTDPRFFGQERWETFPGWSPDGKELYICSAEPCVVPIEYKKLKYALLRIPFDLETGRLGERVDTLYNPAVRGGSICYPRVSPDGKYLLYTEFDCGTMPLWRGESDLRMIDLATGAELDTQVLNSEFPETYHGWSSNGRWIVFASRRVDTKCMRLFFSYLDDEGRFSKPFLLPQQDPAYNTFRMKSFNIPEFIRDEVRVSRRELESQF